MKFFMFLVAAAVIVSGIYHTEITDYIADLSGGSYNAGGPSVLNSMQGAGKSSSAVFDKVGNAFGR